MNLWKQERDRVVERTLAFVEDVIAAKDVITTKATSTDRASAWTTLVAEARTSPELETGAAPKPGSAPSTASETSAAEKSAVVAPLGGAVARRIETSMQDERDEIVRRVTEFRNLQIRIKQQREQYCNAVLAKTRAALSRPVMPPR